MTKFDKVIISISILLSLLGGYLFYTTDYYFKTRDAGSAIAQLKYFSNKVRNKAFDSLTWRHAYANQKLFQGDYVFTDVDSTATIHFKDNSVLEIEPKSLVVIEFTDGVVLLNAKRGGGRILVKGKKGLRLKVGRKILPVRSVNGQEFKIKVKNDKGGLQLKVLSGNSILVGGLKSPLLIGSSILVTKDLKIQKRLSFLGEEKLRQVDYSDPDTTKFKWSSYPDSNGYIVEIATDANFKKSIKKVITHNSSYQLEKLAPGSYWIRVVPKLASMQQAAKVASKSYKFTVVKSASPRLLSPSAEEELNVVNAKATFKLDNRGHSYVIEIKEGNNVRQIKGRSPEVVISDLWLDHYSWRAKLDVPNAQWSEWVEFYAKDKNNSSAVKFISPQRGDKVYILDKNRKINIKFESKWKGPYQIEVSTTSIFHKIIWHKWVRSTQFRFKIRQPGRVYMRVKDKHGRIGAILYFDAIYDFYHLKSPKRVVFLDGKKKRVVFRWNAQKELRKLRQLEKRKKITPKSKFTWVIATDEKFENIIYRKKLHYRQKNTRVWLSDVGTYYWKILYSRQREDYFHRGSDYRKFELKLPPVKAPYMNPKRQIIAYVRTKGLNTNTIRLPKNKIAKFYIIEVYKDKYLKKRLFSKKIRSNIAYWISNRSGLYYYRYRIIDVWNRKSPFSKVGQLLFPISPLDG